MKFLKTYPAPEFYSKKHFPEPVYLEIECNESEWERIHSWLKTNLIFDNEVESQLGPTPKFQFQFNTSIMPIDRQKFYKKQEWWCLHTFLIKQMFFNLEEKFEQTTYDAKKELMWFRVMFFFGVEDAVLFRLAMLEEENS